MGMLEVFEAIGNPEGYIRDNARKQDDNTQALQELYAAGRLGKTVRGIREPRSGLGSLLQGVGILGEVDPRPMIASEEFTYKQGMADEEEQQFVKATRATDAETKRKRAITQGLSDNLAIAGATGQAAAELLAEYPDAADDVNAFLKERAQAAAQEKSERDLIQRVRRAQLHNALNPRSGPTSDPEYIMQMKLGRLFSTPGIKRNEALYGELVLRAEKIAPSDENKARQLMVQANKLKDQIKAAGKVNGIPSEAIDAYMGFDESTNPTNPTGMYLREDDPDRIIRTPEDFEQAWGEEMTPKSGDGPPRNWEVFPGGVRTRR